MFVDNQPAIDILVANDRGGYTIPTPRLYPYQWNWDSAFAALGFAVFDRSRAWTELAMLFEGQWPNGMVPHILFRQNDPDYFPGPSVWQSGTELPSSGHSQPPVVASVALKLVEVGDAEDEAMAKMLFPKMLAFHRWYHQFRDPDQTGLVAITHPWESGRDNCPDWDYGMNGVEVPADLEAYERRDLSHVDADQRPNALQYDRFISIVQYGRKCGWDHIDIYRNGPFLMADPGVQFVLMRADQDLLKLAQRFGEHKAVAELEAWIKQSKVGSEQLWNEHVGAYCAKDIRSGTFSNALTNASMLAFYAGVGNAEQQQTTVVHAEDLLSKVKYAFPSWDPRHEAFESKRYWRGPVWAVMNYMIATGLEECGQPKLANRVKNDTLQLVENSGFFEYFDPVNGEGLGGPDFTWTAAVQLILNNSERSH